MFHVGWIIVCIALGKALALYFFSFTDVSGWAAVITFLILAIPGGFLSWYLYWGGRFLANPISNLFFKNPVAPKKRFLDGFTIRASYALAVLLCAFYPVYKFCTAEFTPHPGETGFFELQEMVLSVYHKGGWFLFLAVWMLVANELKYHPGLFVWIAKLSRPIRDDFRRSHRGDGGDAQFAGFWREFDYPWLPGMLLLGKSLYGQLWVGFKALKENFSDDRHIITMAGSRAGKGISRIIVNLLLWWHNAIIIDPKGENAAVTAHNIIRAQAYVLDPYGMVKNVYSRGDDPSKAKFPPIRARYNIMTDWDAHSPMFAEEVRVFTSGCVWPEADKNKHFEDEAKSIIGGVAGHVKTYSTYEGQRSLVTVYRLLNSASEDELLILITEMRANTGYGDFILEGASSLEAAVTQVNKSVLSTVRRNLQWLSYEKIQGMVEGESDFSIYDVANKPMSLYLCFDMEALENQGRFVRIFFLMAFHAMCRPRGNKTKKVLFLMDEFFTLGYLPMLEKGAQYIAGEGVKLWPIIQNIAMIEALYGKTWTNFTEAAGVIEAFGLSAGDRNGTAHWVHEKLGSSRSANLKLGEAAKSMDTLSLMTQSELEQEFSREGDRSIVFIKGTDPLVLRRKPYWLLFHPDMYRAPAQGVPLNWIQRIFMEEYGWRHARYFGFKSETLTRMGSPFNAARRRQELAYYATQQRQLEVQQLKGLPGPIIDVESKGFFANFQENMETLVKIKEARVFMKYGPNEAIVLDDLKLRYRKYKKEELYADLQEELDQAYRALLKIAA